MKLFKENYPTYHLPEYVVFRLHILRFTCLYARRTHVRIGRDENSTSLKMQVERVRSTATANLPTFRKRNRTRATAWLAKFHGVVVAEANADELEFLLDFEAAPVCTHEGVTLQDLIPPFVRMTHACARLNNDCEPNGNWLSLASDMMLQAIIEQIVLDKLGEGGIDALDAVLESFAWGPTSQGSEAFSPDPNSDDLDAIFYIDGADGHPTRTPWNQKRKQALDILEAALQGRTSDNDGEHANREKSEPAESVFGDETLSDHALDCLVAIALDPQHSPELLDEGMMSFLDWLWREQMELPVLLQLEQYKIAFEKWIKRYPDDLDAERPRLVIHGHELEYEQAESLVELFEHSFEIRRSSNEPVTMQWQEETHADHDE